MIKLYNVTKKYKYKPLLYNANLHIEYGKIYGLIGPNGCGKTTFFNILLNYKQISGGTIKYNTRSIFYLDDKYTLPSNTISGSIKYMKSYDKYFEEHLLINFVTDFDLPNNLKHASKGQRALFALFLSLSSSANLILIDEIFDGLDQLKRDQIVSIIKEYNTDDRSFILIDHNFDRLEDLCTDFIAIKDFQFNVLEGQEFTKDTLIEYLF